MSFCDSEGNSIGSEKKLDFDPCSINFFQNGEFLILGGSNKKSTLWTKDGVMLETIGSQKEWVWTVANRPKTTQISCGSNDGNISLYNVLF